MTNLIFSVATSDYIAAGSNIYPIINTDFTFANLASSYVDNGAGTTTVSWSWSSFTDNGTTNDGLKISGNANFALNVASLNITDFGQVPLSRNSTGGFANLTGQISATDVPTILSNTNFSSLFQSTLIPSAYFGNIGSWPVSNVTNMTAMFNACTYFNQDISSWTVSNVTNMDNMFLNCRNFNQPLNNWNVSKVTTMSNMFSFCSYFNSDISSWNVSAVTNMTKMFNTCTNFNQNISLWNVSASTNMTQMFVNCINFNSVISSWNVSNVLTMAQMLSGCTSFNSDISSWNVSKVTNMNMMFYGCTIFNQDISSWNVSAVTNMDRMFYRCFKFNQAISSWNVLKVTTMSNMFYNCIDFNQSISSWNVSAVTTMNNMFYGCTSFNQNISLWNVLNVTNMSQMFYSCINFNSVISSWNVSKVTIMSSMFYGCINFNSVISSWNVSNVSIMSNMFYGCTRFNQDAIGSWNFTQTRYINVFIASTGYNPTQYGQFLINLQNNATLSNDLNFGIIGLTRYNNALVNAAYTYLTKSVVSGGKGITIGDTVIPDPTSAVLSNSCFPANTPVQTNQGTIMINQINPEIHTIRNMKIVAVVQTISSDNHLVCIEKHALGNNIPSEQIKISKNHKILYKGNMIKIRDLVGPVKNISLVKYTGEMLYNILLEEHEKMVINNLIVETMHPEHRLAKLYNAFHIDKMTIDQQMIVIEELNKIVHAENKPKMLKR